MTAALGYLPGLSMQPRAQTNPSVLCFHVSDPVHVSWLCATYPVALVLTQHGPTAQLTSALSGNFPDQPKPTLDLLISPALSPAQHSTAQQPRLPWPHGSDHHGVLQSSEHSCCPSSGTVYLACHTPIYAQSRGIAFRVDMGAG